MPNDNTASSESQLGESLRRVRDSRRLSVRDLAAKAGFSASFISQVENGQASPSIASLEKIATALDITVADFFQNHQTPQNSVVRAQARPRLNSGWSKAVIESLGPGDASRLEPVLITLRPGGASGKHPHPVLREQFAYVVSGEVTLHLENGQEDLQTGDAVTIPARCGFRWENRSLIPVELLVVSFHP